MDMELPEKYNDIKQTVREFCAKVLKKHAMYHDENSKLHPEVLEGLKGAFLTGITVPEEYEGLGLDTASFVITLEELAKTCPSTALTLAAHTSLCAIPAAKFANTELKKRFVPPLAKGEKFGSFCLTEPDTGSDIANLKTTAIKNGNGYVINGTKFYVTNAKFASTYLLTTMSNPGGSKKERLTTFIIDSNLSGIEIQKEEKKLGMKGSSTCVVSFDNVKVPEENVVLGPDRGFEIMMDTLNSGRIGISAISNGISIAAYNIAMKYAGERKQFGAHLNELQAIQMMLAEMRMNIEAARLLTYNAARLKDEGRNYVKEASMAKLFSSTKAMEITRNAIQILGGYGYMSEYEVERFYRDAKLCEIGEGTSEIQKLIIFKQSLDELL